MIALNKTIRLFLDGIGRREEYEFYLGKFQADTSACFALLCPDRGSIEAGAEMLAFDLHFLLRLELVPAILLCGTDAPAMRDALSAEPIFVFQPLEPASARAFIESARREEKVPVLVAETHTLSDALAKLLPDVSRRVHFVRAAGGIRSATGELVPYAYTHRENAPPLDESEEGLLALGRTLLDAHPALHLSVTSPINLLREIFTVKGAGTLLRRGSEILRFQGLEKVDRDRLAGLLESSFGKPLANRAFLDAVSEAYIERAYRGAVLLERHPAGHYLSKFAVGREARGEGLAQELWQAVRRNHAALFWRSRVSNPFNSWYSRQADGYHIEGGWQVFWRGIPATAISDIVAFCTARPEDFG